MRDTRRDRTWERGRPRPHSMTDPARMREPPLWSGSAPRHQQWPGTEICSATEILETFSLTLMACSPEEIERLRAEYPGVPADYADFLGEIGCGSIGDSGFTVYSSFAAPEEILGPVAAQHIPGLLLFGDDFAGLSLAFDSSHSWRLVEIDSATMRPMPQEESFEQFIRGQIAIYLDSETLD
jgi:hypothetical protein